MESILYYRYSTNGKSTSFIRFYNDGIVVKTTISRHLKDFDKVLVWLIKGSEKSFVQSGKYYRRHDKIEIVFTSKSESKYSGTFKDAQIELFEIKKSSAAKHVGNLSVFGDSLHFEWNKQKPFSFYKYKVSRLTPLTKFKEIEPLRLKSYEQKKSFSFLEEFEKAAKKSDRQENLRISKWVNDKNAQETKRVEGENRQKNEEKKFLWRVAGIVISVLFIVLVFSIWTSKRIGCHCWDGSESSATGTGACSWHKGVMYWKQKYWWETE